MPKLDTIIKPEILRTLESGPHTLTQLGEKLYPHHTLVDYGALQALLFDMIKNNEIGASVSEPAAQNTVSVFFHQKERPLALNFFWRKDKGTDIGGANIDDLTVTIHTNPRTRQYIRVFTYRKNHISVDFSGHGHSQQQLEQIATDLTEVVLKHTNTK